MMKSSIKPAITAIITSVREEFGFDKNLFKDELQQSLKQYAHKRSAYFVIEHEGKIVGGGGFTPTRFANNTCELKGMYFLPEIRGKRFQAPKT